MWIVERGLMLIFKLYIWPKTYFLEALVIIHEMRNNILGK